VPYLTVSIRVTSDVGGEPNVVFDRTHRVALTEAQTLAVTKAGGDNAGVYTTIPTINKIPAINALIIATDQPVNLRMASVSATDGNIALKAGGIFIVVDANIAAGAALNALCNNVGAIAANLSGLVGGT
jgi:hypothetical protein